MNILKYYRRWLTPEEESQLKDPTRRVFCFLGIATAGALIIPSTGIARQLEFESTRSMRIPLQLNSLAGLQYHQPADSGLWISLSPVGSVEDKLVKTLYKTPPVFNFYPKEN